MLSLHSPGHPQSATGSRSRGAPPRVWSTAGRPPRMTTRCHPSPRKVLAAPPCRALKNGVGGAELPEDAGF